MREKLNLAGTYGIVFSGLFIALLADEYAYGLVDGWTWAGHLVIAGIPAYIGAAIKFVIYKINKYEAEKAWWQQYEQDMAELEYLREQAEREERFKRIVKNYTLG